MRLASLSLRPDEYHALVSKFGIRHQWHEDFYDPATGEALQPRVWIVGNDRAAADMPKPEEE